MDARIEQVVSAGKCTLDDTEYDVENNTWIVGDDDAVIVIDPAHDAEAILKAVDGREVMAVICTDGHDAHLNTVLEVAMAGEDDEEDWAPIGLHRGDRLLWRDYFRRLASEAKLSKEVAELVGTDDSEDSEETDESEDKDAKDAKGLKTSKGKTAKDSKAAKASKASKIDEDVEFLKNQEPDIYLEDGGVFEIADVQLDVIHTPGHTPGSICLYSEQLGVLFTGDTLHKGKPGQVGDVYPELRQQLNSIGSLLAPMPRDTRVLPGQGDETTVGEEDSRWESWYSLITESDD
ncbi:MBL fold metallo-hydrolase [Actinomadura sp. HBU206391]|uniref:MBL fold metallo-hydrolase n=1 Tax=Actinomadura sp. HBU206391 TaxID=2731692 RepID=UPI00164FECBB|nr:MBL fold metallo-hydrolase [Actinomadura sp. HBU206391]MBC6463367.1 MBL fold metallo-hydrolase [Actinomadura sp. HBU206391]